MPPLNRTLYVTGPNTLKRGRLRFKTAGALLAQEALQAKAAGRNFTVALEGKDLTGKVMNVELIEGAKPAHWEIVMRVRE